jgi:methionyl aminopeptidase
MTADTESDIRHLRVIGRICAEALKKMMAAVRAGISTGELDGLGLEFLRAEGARSAPQVMYQFPGATCISVSPVIAHGIPGDYVLQPDDLIHIDVSAELEGYYGDTGASLTVSAARPQVGKLLEATKGTLWKALRAAKAGRPLNDIGKTVYQEAHKRGFGVIYDLTGHGIGLSLHEQPREILNYSNPRDKRILHDGLVLAIEPFLTTGRGHVVEEKDGWSLRTIDNAIAAQFEHTIIVTKGDPIILTL